MLGAELRPARARGLQDRQAPPETTWAARTRGEARPGTVFRAQLSLPVLRQVLPVTWQTTRLVLSLDTAFPLYLSNVLPGVPGPCSVALRVFQLRPIGPSSSGAALSPLRRPFPALPRPPHPPRAGQLAHPNRTARASVTSRQEASPEKQVLPGERWQPASRRSGSGAGPPRPQRSRSLSSACAGQVTIEEGQRPGKRLRERRRRDGGGRPLHHSTGLRLDVLGRARQSAATACTDLTERPRPWGRHQLPAGPGDVPCSGGVGVSRTAWAEPHRTLGRDSQERVRP